MQCQKMESGKSIYFYRKQKRNHFFSRINDPYCTMLSNLSTIRFWGNLDKFLASQTTTTKSFLVRLLMHHMLEIKKSHSTQQELFPVSTHFVPDPPVLDEIRVSRCDVPAIWICSKRSGSKFDPALFEFKCRVKLKKKWILR